MRKPPPPHHPIHLRPNDRIVFLGDSITEQQLYTNYTEAYLVSRYPELNLTFFNAGWGGDTAAGGVKRLERDVLFCKPTLVTICFGMNDGLYRKLTDTIRTEFAASMREMVFRLRSAGVRVVLLTPGFADENVDNNLRAVKYNRVTLRALADEVLELAKRESIPAFDLHALMTDVDRRARMAKSGIKLTAEGIHPTPGGHLVMAFGLLQALGVAPHSHEVELDYRTATVTASKGIVAKVVRNERDVRISVRMPTLPFFVEEAARAVLPFVPFEEMYNNLRVRVTGSTSKACSLRTMGLAHLTGLTKKRLAAGINVLSLSGVATPVSMPDSTKVFNRTNEKTQVYYKLWRVIALDTPSSIDAPYYDRAGHALAVRTSEHIDRVRAKVIAAAARDVNIILADGSLQPGELDNGDFITSWSLAGPFPNPVDADHLGGEAAFSASPPKLDKRWLRRSIDTSNLTDCLTGIFGVREFCTCYAVTTLESPIDQSCELLVGSDDGVAVWLNGELLESRLQVPRGLTPDSDRMPARLRKGNNVLLLKISQYNGGWGFCARFGGLLRSVKIQN